MEITSLKLCYQVRLLLCKPVRMPAVAFSHHNSCTRTLLKNLLKRKRMWTKRSPQRWPTVTTETDQESTIIIITSDSLTITWPILQVLRSTRLICMCTFQVHQGIEWHHRCLHSEAQRSRHHLTVLSRRKWNLTALRNWRSCRNHSKLAIMALSRHLINRHRRPWIRAHWSIIRYRHRT